MSKGFFNVPIPTCEPVKSYAPGTPEREEVLAEYKKMYNSNTDIPMYIGSEEVFTNDKRNSNRKYNPTVLFSKRPNCFSKPIQSFS